MVSVSQAAVHFLPDYSRTDLLLSGHIQSNTILRGVFFRLKLGGLQPLYRATHILLLLLTHLLHD